MELEIFYCIIVACVVSRERSIEEGNAPLHRRTNATSVIIRNTGGETRTKPAGCKGSLHPGDEPYTIGEPQGGIVLTFFSPLKRRGSSRASYITK
jgi:hypothetical protein